MKKLNAKKSIILVTIIAIVLLITTNVYATGAISLNLIQTPTPELTPTDTNAGNNTNNTTNITVQPSNTQVSSYVTNTNLPQTGDASDYAIFLVIAVSVVAAGYAYKKVRDYNI